jgi:hypothetical protein
MTATFEMLIADAAVADLNILLAGLAPNVRSRLIQPGEDALGAIFDALAQPGLSRLHLLGHGMPGAIVLGGRQLGAGDFRRRAAGVTVNAAPRQLDIAFWSCLTGCGKQGRTFVEAVAGATGARVSAASGLVGSAARNGSWNLDIQIQPPFAAEAREHYSGLV